MNPLLLGYLPCESTHPRVSDRCLSGLATFCNHPQQSHLLQGARTTALCARPWHWSWAAGRLTNSWAVTARARTGRGQPSRWRLGGSNAWPHTPILTARICPVWKCQELIFPIPKGWQSVLQDKVANVAPGRRHLPEQA